MNLLKGRDAMNHRSVNRCATQNAPRPAGRPEGTRISKSKTEPKTETRRTFLEDFNMEHCCTGVSAALMAFSASSDSAEAGASRKAYAHPTNPPSCIYLG
jgi:hypothetical protein